MACQSKPHAKLIIRGIRMLLLVLSSAALVCSQSEYCDLDFDPSFLAPIDPSVVIFANATLLEFQGSRRYWYTKFPPATSLAEPIPLVLSLHGASACPQLSFTYDGWSALSTEDNPFVLVWPAGETDGVQFQCWNAGSCCCFSAENTRVESPDVDFLMQLIAEVVGTSPVPIDTKRIYLAGHSNGCQMAQAMAAEMSHTIAAVCCHSGGYMGSITPGTGTLADYKPVPIFIVHGDQDPIVPYHGSAFFPAAEDNIAMWAAANRCENFTQTNLAGGVTRHVYSECGNAARAELVQLAGVGHRPFKASGGLGLLAPQGTFETDVATTTLAMQFCFEFAKDAHPELRPCTKCNGMERPLPPAANVTDETASGTGWGTGGLGRCGALMVAWLCLAVVK